MIARLAESKSILDLCLSAVQEVQRLTSFDRVMVYRFHEDLHGEVIAEAVRPGVESYLGLHYPASDIPAPARAVFQRNWLRMIPDVKYESSPVVPEFDPVSGAPLDLSKSVLRSVSPLHLEYLGNMGVEASVTVSLLQEGKLWGLIACHHLGPKFVCVENRTLCELVGRLTSALLHAKETIEPQRESGRLRSYQASLRHGRWSFLGKIPSLSQLEALVTWLDSHRDEGSTYLTKSLPLVFPEAEAYKDIACGLLALSLPKSERNFILWFRPELIQTITWAGNPEKGEERPGTEQRIRPRKSFEAWKQLVKLRSAPWKPLGDRGCDGAEELDSGPWIWSDNSVRRRGRAREELMSVLSHDLKNPLSSIDLNLALISRLCVPELLKPVRSPFERIVRSVQIMRLPIEDILEITRIETGNVSLNRMEVDASEVVEEAGEMLASIDEEKNLEMVMLKMPEDCITRCDRGRTSQAGLVEVPDFRHGARDSQGEIWAESEPGRGSDFHFTLPAHRR